MRMYQAHFLGDFQLTVEPGEAVRFRDRKTAALLAYLLYYSQRTHRREELADRFWPESEARAGRNSLNTALSSLRRQLDPEHPLIFSSLQSVWVDHALVSRDTTLFEQAIQSAQQARRGEAWERVVALYTGEFLAGFYDDWVLLERYRLQSLFRGALRALVLQCETEGATAQALSYAQRWTLEEPLEEEAHASLIRLYTAQEQSDLALRQYQLLCQLREQEGLPPPSAELKPTPPRQFPQVTLPAYRLPLPMTHFVGREAERAQLISLAHPDSKTRLVTVTGPGGSGKTRLMQEVGRELLGPWQQRICFVPLLSLTEPELLPEALCQALQLSRSAEEPALDQALKSLSKAPTLLLLDNLEHLLGAEVLTVLQALLYRVPSLKLLITSQKRLGLPHEREVPLAPLPPEEALALFSDRAQAARPGFALTPETQELAERICLHLEGIPLALELAASRVLTLSLSRILQETENRFELLVLGEEKPFEDGRHRALHSTISWSYNLLSPSLQRFFVRLAVFRDGWSLAAAEAICQELESSLNAHDALSQLLLYSLITMTEEGETLRYRLLESLREFGLAKLTSEERNHARQSHALWYAQYAETFERRLSHKNIGQLHQENANLEAALHWANENQDNALLLRLVCAIGLYWVYSFQRQHGLHWLTLALRRAPQNDCSPQCAQALHWAGLAAEGIWDFDQAEQLYDQSLALYRQLGDKCSIADVLRRKVTHRTLHLPESRTYLLESLSLYRELDEVPGEIATLSRLGAICLESGALPEAESYLRQAAELAQRTCDYQKQAWALTNLGDSLKEQDRLSEARVCYLQGRKAFAQAYDTWGLASVHHDLTFLALMEEDTHAALSLADLALQLSLQTGDEQEIGIFMQLKGIVAHSHGDFTRARKVYEEGLVRQQRLKVSIGVALLQTYLGVLAVEEGELTEARTRFQASLPFLNEWGDRKRQLLGFVGVLGVLAEQERWQEAHGLLTQLEGLLPPFGRVFVPVHQRLYEGYAQRVRAVVPAREDVAVSFAVATEITLKALR